MTQAVAVWNKARSLTATASTAERSTATKTVPMQPDTTIIQLPDLSKREKKGKEKKENECCISHPVIVEARFSVSLVQRASPIEAGVRIWNTQAIRLPTGYPRGSAAVAMLTRPVIKEANLFNMSMLALLAAINKRRPQECCVCFFSAPGCFHLVCIFSGFCCLVIQQSSFLLLA